MDWITVITSRWAETVCWLAGLGAAFALLARLSPAHPGMYWWKDRRAVVTDLAYWFVVPLVPLVGRILMLAAAAVLVLGGGSPAPTPVAAWPLWGQAVVVLLLQDVVLYWLHRAFHTRHGWAFHAVHHSPRVLDWTACARFHPVNQLLEFALADVLILLMGFPPLVLVALAPFNLIYSAMVHANLDWTFGPLRYVFASPVFHRWHHTSEEEGLDRNFASTFPFLDLLFGTFSMPAGKRPERFGVAGREVADGFWGQLVRPFRAAVPVAVLAAGVLVAGGLVVGRSSPAPVPEGKGGRENVGAGYDPPVVAQPQRPAATAVATNPDGRLVVIGDEDGTVRIRGTSKDRGETAPGRHRDRRVTGVAVSADGMRVVSAGIDGTLRVWDRGGSAPLTVKAHVGGVAGVALSADGRRVVSGGADGTVRVWDADGREERILPADGAVTGVAVSGDGRLVAASLRRVARVWDLETGREVILRGHTDLVACVALTRDGTRAVTGGFDGKVKVWDVTAARELCTLVGHHRVVAGVAVSADGRTVVSGGGDGKLRVWDAAGAREIAALAGHTGGVTAVAMNADGSTAVSAGRDGTVRVWDVASRQPAAVWVTNPPDPGTSRP